MDIEEAETWARLMMDDHGLLAHGWQVRWDRARTRAGQCRYSPRVISLSRYWAQVDDEEDFMDTVAHEVAHALVGPAHGHDALWSATALRLGGSGLRQRTARFDPRAPWRGTCPHGIQFHRYRVPARDYVCTCDVDVPSGRRIIWQRAA